MKHFKVPEGIDQISVDGVTYVVSEGLIEVENASLEHAAKLKEHVGAVPASEQEVETAGNRATVKTAKEQVVAQLKELGVVYDGRASLSVLEDKLKAALAAKAQG